MKERMKNQVKKEIRAMGMRVLLSRHKDMRRLKRHHQPSFFGNSLWNSSWLLMDYFRRRGLPKGARIMEVGCGWGLAGIYCAKKKGALVTAVDVDSEVFPFLQLHAEINKTQISFQRKQYNGITCKVLSDYDYVIGSDICYYYEMVDPLRRLIRRALRSGVKSVVLADPGRGSFEELGECFCRKGTGEILDWTVRHPRFIEGRILKVTNRLLK
jgi:predicted nicotinamide N-methyase